MCGVVLKSHNLTYACLFSRCRGLFCKFFYKSGIGNMTWPEQFLVKIYIYIFLCFNQHQSGSSWYGTTAYLAAAKSLSSTRKSRGRQKAETGNEKLWLDYLKNTSHAGGLKMFHWLLCLCSRWLSEKGRWTVVVQVCYGVCLLPCTWAVSVKISLRWASMG